MVKIRSSAAIPQVGVADKGSLTQRRNVGVEGAAMEKTGTLVNEIGTRIREQQIDNDLLQSDLNAQKIVSAKMAGLRTRDDWEAFEGHAETFVRDAYAQTRPKNAGLRGQRAWTEATARRTLEARQRAQTLGLQRGTELNLANVESMRGQALLVISDENTTPEMMQTARDAAMASAATARARGFLGADDVERMRTSLDGAVAERVRRVAQETRLVGFTDKAAEAGDGLEERLAWVQENVPAQDREKVNDRVAQSWSRQEAARAASRKESLNEAWGLVYQGTLPDQMPRELQQRLENDDKIRMRDYLETRWRSAASRESHTGDNELYANGIAAARSNPRVFVQQDLERFRGQLSKSQFERLERLQAQTSADLETGRLNPEVSLTTRLQRAARQTSIAANTELTTEQRRALDGHIARVVLEWSDANDGSLPTDQEQRQIVQAAMRRGRGERYVFEASDEQRVRVPYKDIPPAVRNRLIEEARIAKGEGYGSIAQWTHGMLNQTSRREIEERYADMLALRTRGSR